MIVKTFRARSLPDALQMVRMELGSDARVLATTKASASWWRRITGRSPVEVTALSAPGATRAAAREPLDAPQPVTTLPDQPALDEIAGGMSYREYFKQSASAQPEESLFESIIEQQALNRQLPSTLFRLFSDLIDQDVDDRLAKELVEEVHRHSTPAELADFDTVRTKTVNMLTSRIAIAPEIQSHRAGRRVVALIGPTGVGKTTTIAKLAANLRLRDKRRVGLITVDTYRIAAVDQLRAYADIIDLPMEVVTTPREMRQAVTKLSECDIVLIDTAGRSPHDEIQLQELKAMLTEARADEVQLVVSGVSHGRHLTRLVQHFRPVSPTSILLTKLDEAVSLGHLLSLMCDESLPVSYTTHGQNVPDDIQPADPARLVDAILAS